MKVTHTHGKVSITFQRIRWENLAATENAIPRIIVKIKAKIITFIVINMNPIVTKVKLNSLIIIINNCFTDFARKFY